MLIKNLIDRLSNKERLLLSIIGFGGTVLGGISITVLLQNIWSFVVALGVVGSLNMWFGLYDDAKEKYCYELSDNYFYKNKDNLNEDKEKYILNKLVSMNKFCNKLQVGVIPISLFLVLLLFSFGISLPIALTICGSVCFSSLLFTISCSEFCDFYIDVMCEVLEHISATKKELVVVSKELSIEKKRLDAFSLNPGISKYRFNHMPKDVQAQDLSEDEVVEVVSHFGKILQRTNTRR